VILKIENLHKSFHNRVVIDGLSLNVQEGDLIALIGPSGCGKSTFLRCLNGLETMDSGKAQIIDTVLNSPAEIGQHEFHRRSLAIRQKVGMVFQSFNLFPHLTILENIIKAPLVVRKIDKASAEVKARELLTKVGLGDKAHHFPDQLSGGQQQRAAIARALAMSPSVLLYDEPTSSLDPALVNEVLLVMKQLDQEGMTQIVVTHEMRFARDVADKIVFIEHGKIVEMGPPDQIFGNPQNERTKNFLRHFL
jgi:ABC-type polar amino acid transport system ATPase subunit